MYKCRLVYDEWKCMKSKEQKGKFIKTEDFVGYIGDLRIHEVSEKQIWKYRDKDIVVCDNQYRWLSIMPKDDFYCITVMLNQLNEIQVCYIDMIESQGIDEDGIPYFIDLYLDLVVYPTGEVIVDDRDELEDAFNQKEISGEQYERAIKTAQKLQHDMLNDYCMFEKRILELRTLLDIKEYLF